MLHVVLRQHNLKLNDIYLGVRPLDVDMHGFSEGIMGTLVVSVKSHYARAFVSVEAVGAVLFA